MFISGIFMALFILCAIVYVYLGYTKHVEADLKYSRYMRIGMYSSLVLLFISLIFVR